MAGSSPTQARQRNTPCPTRSTQRAPIFQPNGTPQPTLTPEAGGYDPCAEATLTPSGTGTSALQSGIHVPYGDYGLGVYRPSNNRFYLRYDMTSGVADVNLLFGTTNDIPVTGDWDGDGYDSIGVFRPSTSTWYLRNSNSPAYPGVDYTFTFGDGPHGDIPVVGNWDSAGGDGVGVFRPGTNTFYLKNTLPAPASPGRMASHVVLGPPDYTFTVNYGAELPSDTARGYKPGQSPVIVGNGFWNEFGAVHNGGVATSPTLTLYLNFSAANALPVVGKWYGGVVEAPAEFANGTFYLTSGDYTCDDEACYPPYPLIVWNTVLFGTSGDLPLGGRWERASVLYTATPLATGEVYVNKVPELQATRTVNGTVGAGLSFRSTPASNGNFIGFLPVCSSGQINGTTVPSTSGNGRWYVLNSGATPGWGYGGDVGNPYLVSTYPASCPTRTPTPTPGPTLTPTITLTPSRTATLGTMTVTPSPTATPVIQTDQQRRDFLHNTCGVDLQGSEDYWSDPTFSQRVKRSEDSEYSSRIHLIYDMVVYIDQNQLYAATGVGSGPCEKWRAVFGHHTIFLYTGQVSADNSAAETQPISLNSPVNNIWLFNVSGAQDATDARCGSRQTPTGPLDITRCTILHELGHVLVARAAQGVNFATEYGPIPPSGPQVASFYSACPGGGTRWDPGELGWPWRDHPLRGPGTYIDRLCRAERSIVIREFEADMLMNFFLNLFDPNSYEQGARMNWTGSQLLNWVQDAKYFTDQVFD